MKIKALKIRFRLFSLISLSVLMLYACATKQDEVQQSKPEFSLVERILPDHADQFIIELENSETKDWFEIESKKNKILLRGNNGVSIASALYYYLKEYCNCQITWNGTNLNLPDKLPGAY